MVSKGFAWEYEKKSWRGETYMIEELGADGTEYVSLITDVKKSDYSFTHLKPPVQNKQGFILSQRTSSILLWFLLII